MIEINFSNVSKSYGFKNILSNMSFVIKTGERVAIVGDNGSGKTTILNLVVNIENANSGIITLNKNKKIFYLKQSPAVYSNKTLARDVLYESLSDIIHMNQRMIEYESLMAIGKVDNKTLVKYSELQEKFINCDGYEVIGNAKKIIKKLKIEYLLDKNYNNLSSGEKQKIGIASIMISKPSIILLDEPTNHLDIEFIEILENYLSNYNGTVVVVSHDRCFLDKVVKKVMLIERGECVIFNGNYSDFVKENEERIERDLKQYKDEQKQVQALKRKIKQLEEFGRLAYPGGESFFKRAENIRKRLERMELIQKPMNKTDIPLEFCYEKRSGEQTLIIGNFDLRINNTLLISDINIKIQYGDRVCLMGNNGCGKSTLIKEIIKNDNLCIRQGSNVKIGYIPQNIIFDQEKRVLEYSRSFYEGDEMHLRSSLSKFGFYYNDVFKKVSNLSGGEKVRLKLFELMIKKSNFIILDEPTNHLDINTREILESALSEFDGTILFVSHDRYLVNKLANYILYIDNKQITKYLGNYDDFKLRIELN